MQIDVIVLRHGTNHSVGAWQSNTERDGQIYTLNQHGIRIRHEDAWADLAVKINQLACDDIHMPADVFLYLRDPLLEGLYNYDLVKRIVSEARNHAWAGNLYLAWDKEGSTAFPTVYTGQAQMLEKWLRVLSEESVTDLIEISKNARSKDQNEYNMLRARALSAENRRKDLQEFVSGDGWSAILRDEARFLEDFLRLMVKTKLLPSDGKNHIVFYDQTSRRGLTKLLEKSRNLNRDGNRLIATIPSRNFVDLERLCQQDSPALKLIEFNGAFEWLYALIRLNQHRGSSASTPPSDDHSQYYIEWVEPSEKEQFHCEPNNGPLRLLVTSSFHQSEGEGYRVAAAREIGALLRSLPFHIDIEVHPCIKCELLPGVLGAGQLTAWLHLSHGKKEKGLYEAETGEYASPERWLACFNAYRGSLQLVVLSACESAAIAKLFAAAGVGVAIGFENEVLTEATRIVTERVIPAALQTGDRQGAIIAAFQEACQNLSSRTYLHVGAERSYIDARPSAFARVKS